MHEIIKIRKEKLEEIKPYITLKSYNIISEKIDAEAQLFSQRDLAGLIAAKNQTALPEQYFEKSYMKIKQVWIA